MSSCRGALPLAGVLLVAASATAAHAERFKAFGFELTSSEWTLGDAIDPEAVELNTESGQRAKVMMSAVTPSMSCTSVAKPGPGTTPRPPGRLAKYVGFTDENAFMACREARGRMFAIVGAFFDDSMLSRDAQEAAYATLFDEIERSIAAQSDLHLERLDWDLGPRFARWQPTVEMDGDSLQLVGPTEVETFVSVRREPYGCVDALHDATAKLETPPAFVPRGYGREVAVVHGEKADSTFACIDHGAGHYLVQISFTAGKKPAKKTEASVKDLLGAIATAIAASPPITADDVSSASELETLGSSTPAPKAAPTLDPTPTPAPTTPEATTPPAPAAEDVRVASADPAPAPTPAELPGYASSTYASSDSTPTRSTRGWYSESPVLMLRVHQLAFDATMTADGTDAIGGSIAIERPLVIEELGGAEWSGALGYDELGGISYDVRGGVGVWFARPMTLRIGAGLDGWRGTDTGGELPTDVYAYIGGQVPIGPVSVRAEYLPRNGGTDEKRVRVGFTRLRHAGRKIVVAGDAHFFDGATVLSLGVGAGI